MKNGLKKGIASVLLAALVIGILPSGFAPEPLKAADSEEVNPIMYPLSMHTSTEPAWPCAYDDAEAWADYRARYLPAFNAPCGYPERSFVYASTAMLDAFSRRRDTTGNYSSYVGKEAAIYNAVFSNGVNGLADSLPGHAQIDAVTPGAFQTVTSGSLTYAALHGGDPSMVAELLSKWRPAGVNAEAKLLDAFWADMSTEEGEPSEVKYWVRNYGAAAVEMNGPDDAFYQITNKAYYRNEAYDPASAKMSPYTDFWTNTNPQYALIVGWDDDYPRENFLDVPSNNGAWLVRNTLSVNLGFSNYFWVSYEDKGLSEKAAVFVQDAVSSLRSDKNYYYDNQYHEVRQLPGGTYTKDAANTNEVRVANVYKIQGTEAHQYVDAVSFYYDPDAVSPGKEGGSGLADQNPATMATVIIRKTDINGKPATTGDDTLLSTVTHTPLHGKGRYTIPMKQAVVLDRNHSYAVEVQLDHGTVALEAGNLTVVEPEPELIYETGEPVLRLIQEVDKDGNPVFDPEGNPKMKEEPVTGVVYNNFLQPIAGCNAGESFYYSGDKNGVANSGTWKDLTELYGEAAYAHEEGYTYGNFCINLLTTETAGVTPYTELRSNDFEIALSNSDRITFFQNQDVRPDVTVTKKNGGQTLTQNVDYKVVYINNFDASDALNAGDARVYVIGMGQYIGVLSSAFTIVPIRLSGEDLDKSPVPKRIPAVVEIEDTADVTYDRTRKMPKVKRVSLPIYGVTHEVSRIYYRPEYGEGVINVNAGKNTAEVWVVAKPTTKNYLEKSYNVESEKTHFTILPLNIAEASISLNPEQYTYTGNPITPAFTVIWGSYTLTPGVDYTYEYRNNIDVGTAEIVVTGIHDWDTGLGNYYGTLSRTFKIVGESLAKAQITVDPMVFIYNRKEQTPDITVRFGQSVLVEGEDYEVLYPDDCTNVGQKDFIVHGLLPQYGTVELSYWIIPRDISEDPVGTLSVPGDYSYTGKPIIPTYSLVVDGYVLDEDIDYTTTFSNNVNIGIKAKVTVEGIGNYTGILWEYFTIRVASLADAKVTVTPSSYDETGYAVEPGNAITVEVNGRILKRGVDYVVSYTSNRLPGTATVTITGRGNYSGKTYGSFTIISKKSGQTTDRAEGSSSPEGTDTGEEEGSSSSITPSPGEEAEDYVPDTAIVSGITVPLKNSDTVVTAKQKISVKSELTNTYKKYKVLQKAMASVTNSGVLTAKKSGTITVVGYQKKNGKWKPVEAVSLYVDVPTFNPKSVTTRTKTVNLRNYLDTVAEPTKWMVSDKKKASIDAVTGKLTFKKKGTVTVTVVFGSGKKAAKYKVKVTRK